MYLVVLLYVLLCGLPIAWILYALYAIIVASRMKSSDDDHIPDPTAPDVGGSF